MKFVKNWSTEKHWPAIIMRVYPKPWFFIGMSFFGHAIVKHSWWKEWTRK